MIYGEYRRNGAPGAAGETSLYGAIWILDGDEHREGGPDPVTEAYQAHLRHLEVCCECGTTRCTPGQ